MKRAFALVIALSGCGSDVLLGGRTDGGFIDDRAMPDASDGGSDAHAPLNAFGDGDFDLTIAATISMTLCTGSLGGMDSAFASITRDSLGLREGPVNIVGRDATHFEVSGMPIELGYRQSSIVLEKGGAPGAPADVWVGFASRVETGPASTDLIGLDLEASELTLTPSGFDGRASALYADLTAEGQCAIGFDAHFARR